MQTWSTRVGMPAGLRAALVGVELSPAQTEALRIQEAELNQTRLRFILPLMIVMNLAHMVLLYPGSPFRVDDRTELLAWGDGLFIVHTITAFVALVPLAIAWRSRLAPSWAGPLGASVYQLHAAAIAGVDQLNHGTVAPYVAYALVNVVVVAMTPRQAIVVFGSSTIAFLTALTVMQDDVVSRAALMPTGPSVMVPAVCIAWFLHNARRQNFYYQETIGRQQNQLEELNGALQERVDAQVASLVARAEEVELLNLQLRERVRDRSRELALALGRLAVHEQDTPESFEGRVLAGRFAVAELLGSGGMGLVYAGVDRHTGEEVAIKMLRRTTVSTTGMARFLREVETAASLHHPAIVRMLHVDVTEDGVPFQVQERVIGDPLSTVLERLGVLSPAVALPLLTVLCDALVVAHAAGVVHRDIKPSNLMLVPDAPGLKLLDFGIAKQALVDQTGLTATGAILGTPAYMGPELWEGAEATPATDVFAVGITAFRMLSGRLPRAHLGQVEITLDLPTELSGELIEVLRACVAFEPAMRPTIARLSEVLRACPLPPETPIAPWFEQASESFHTATHLSFGS